MKKLILSAFLLISVECFAEGLCGTITARYIGPSGGEVCYLGTNCTSSFTAIGVGRAGASCNDSPKPDDCKITVDTSNTVWSCVSYSGNVVRLTYSPPPNTCGNVAVKDIAMPPYRCWATFYVIATCTYNFETGCVTLTVDACNLNDPSFCTCNFLTGGEDQ